jgi:UDP-N-acetylglucosamine diphosphorylase/glucosamine-1-phosphate N-acetyltransferase
VTSPAALYLIDDHRARRWAPFAATRPVGELLHGCFRQRERAERFFGVRCAGHLVAPRLSGFQEEGTPPVLRAEEVGSEGTRIILSSRAVLEGPSPFRDGGPTDGDLRKVKRLRVGGEPVGWILPDGSPLPGERALDDPSTFEGNGDEIDLDGTILGWPWDLVAANADRIAGDLDSRHRTGDSFLLTDVHVLGDHAVSLGHGAKVEAGVVLDVRDGPVRLEADARVQAPARITGPTWVGRGSVVLGGSVAHASIGPVCKVRGEVEASVFFGWDNKAHDGYLGHAYLGRWVNLGAFTTNSDLKNSYSPVRVPVGPAEEVDTGLLKVGAFVGDHVKTGIGTLLNTGTVLGVGSNVFGGAMPPRWVPPFSWGVGEALVEYRLEKFLEVAAAAMARREVDLDGGMRKLLTRVWEESRTRG